MKRMIFSLLALSAVLSMCTTPSTIGTDFIGDDIIELDKVDSIPIVASTYGPSPIVVYDSISALGRYLAGNLSDPIFGQSSSQIFCQARMINLNQDFENTRLDSVILTLRYDSAGCSGDFREEPITVEVFRLMEDMIQKERYTSDREFAVMQPPIGQKNNIIPNVSDNVPVTIELSDQSFDTVSFPPCLRIPLDPTIGEEILSYDSMTLASNANFLPIFKGLNIRVNSVQSMLAFDMLNSISNITVYYHKDDTLARRFVIGFTQASAIVPNFSHDISGTPVEAAVSNPSIGDSLVYTQAMAGPEIQVEFPDLSRVENEIINYAELSFTIAHDLPNNDTTLFPTIEQVTAVYLDDEQEIRLISDAVLAESNPRTGPDFIDLTFGGFVKTEILDNGTTVEQYQLYITNHLKEMIAGARPTSIRIRPRAKSISSNRTIVYGPGHSTFPMTLDVFVSNNN